MTLKTLFLAVVISVLAGCENNDIQKPDQCLRREIFKECMKLLPNGPSHVKYNDWDEVVKACGEVSYYQSIRRLSMIPEKCRP